MCWRLFEDKLQRRPYVGLHDVTAVRQAIGVTEDHVGMDLGRPILLQGNVAMRESTSTCSWRGIFLYAFRSGSK